MHKKTYIEMDYGELEKLVREQYGQTYEFVADITCGNDSSHAYSYEKHELDEWEAQQLEEFKKTGVYAYAIHVLMQDMVNRDVLEPGNYLIHVCW